MTLDESNIMDILNAAKKYCIDNLVGLCEKYLCSSIATENLAVWMEASEQFDLTDLWDACIQFIVKNTHILYSGSCLNSLRISSLEKMLASENLSVCETNIYEWLEDGWVRAECGRQGMEYSNLSMRKVLGKVLYKVRFPLMNLTYFRKEFVKHNYTEDLLTESEILDVEKSINHPSRTPQYFQNHLRRNIFDALGWASIYYEQSHGFSLSATKKCIITLKSVIIKTSESQMKVTIESDKDAHFGSTSTTQTLYVSLKAYELNNNPTRRRY